MATASVWPDPAIPWWTSTILSLSSVHKPRHPVAFDRHGTCRELTATANEAKPVTRLGRHTNIRNPIGLRRMREFHPPVIKQRPRSIRLGDGRRPMIVSMLPGQLSPELSERSDSSSRTPPARGLTHREEQPVFRTTDLGKADPMKSDERLVEEAAAWIRGMVVDILKRGVEEIRVSRLISSSTGTPR